MTENKRFTTNGYKIYDTFHDGIHWLVNQVEANEIVDKMNNLDSKARERSKALSKLQKENEQLKQFKEKVFTWIDKEIARNEEAIEWGKETGADSGAMGFYNHMLNRLKKELKE